MSKKKGLVPTLNVRRKAVCSFHMLQLVRYESSRGHNKDGIEPNQTGNTAGEKKNGNRTEGNNGQEELPAKNSVARKGKQKQKKQ